MTCGDGWIVHIGLWRLSKRPGSHRGDGQGVDGGLEPAEVVALRVVLVELLLEVGGELDAVAGAGDERVLDQPVVLAEPDEDGGEDPGDGDLGDPLPQPGLEGRGGAVGGLRGAPLDLEPVAGQAGRLQVGLEESYLLLECLELDHDAFRSFPSPLANSPGT